MPPRPALFTTTSSRPWAATVPSTIACTCSSTVTSHTKVAGRVPPASAVELVGGLAEPALVGVAQHDRGALLDAAAGGGVADAGAGGGGDQHDLAGEQVAPRQAAWAGGITAGSFGEAEGALADDVALDLVGAAVDGVAAAEEEQALEAGEVG